MAYLSSAKLRPDPEPVPQVQKATIKKTGEANTDTAAYESILESYLGGIYQPAAEKVVAESNPTAFNQSVNDPYLAEFERRRIEAEEAARKAQEEAAKAAAAKATPKSSRSSSGYYVSSPTPPTPTLSTAQQAQIKDLEAQKAQLQQKLNSGDVRNMNQANQITKQIAAIDSKIKNVKASASSTVKVSSTPSTTPKTTPTTAQAVDLQSQKKSLENTLYSGTMDLNSSQAKDLQAQIAQINSQIQTSLSTSTDNLAQQKKSLQNTLYSGNIDPASGQAEEIRKQIANIENVESGRNERVANAGNIPEVVELQKQAVTLSQALSNMSISAQDRAEISRQITELQKRIQDAKSDYVETGLAKTQSQVDAEQGYSVLASLGTINDSNYGEYQKEKAISTVKSQNLEMQMRTAQRELDDIQAAINAGESNAVGLYNQKALEYNAMQSAKTVADAAINITTDAINNYQTEKVTAYKYSEAAGAQIVADIDKAQIEYMDAARRAIAAEMSGTIEDLNEANAQYAKAESKYHGLQTQLFLWNQGKISYEAAKALDVLPKRDRDDLLLLVKNKENLSDIIRYNNGVGHEESFTGGLDAQQTETYISAVDIEARLKATYGADYAQLLEYAQIQYNADKRKEQQKMLSGMNGAEKAVFSAASVITNVFSIPGALTEIITQPLERKNKNIGYDINASGFAMQNLTQDIRSAATENMGAIGKKLYSTVMSGLDSAAAMVIGGGAGRYLLGATAATNAMSDITARGGSMEDAITGGIAAGVFECLFESVSIGNFEKLADKTIINNAKEFLGEVGKSVLVNFTEEANTELANILYDKFVLGNVSNYQTEIRRLMSEEGLTEAQAKKALSSELAVQIIEAGLSGALMGAAFGAVGATSAYSRSSLTIQPENTDTFRKFESFYETAQSLPWKYQPEARYTAGQTTDADVRKYGEKVRQAYMDYAADIKSGKIEVDSEAYNKLSELGKYYARTIASGNEIMNAIDEGMQTAVDEAELDTITRDIDEIMNSGIRSVLQREAQANAENIEQAEESTAESNPTTDTLADTGTEAFDSIQTANDTAEENVSEIANDTAENTVGFDSAIPQTMQNNVSEQTENSLNNVNIQSANENINGGNINGAEQTAESAESGSSVLGGQGRIYDESAEGQAARVGEITEGRTDGGTSSAGRRNSRTSIRPILRAEGVTPVSSASLGITNGSTTANLYVVPESRYEEFGLTRITNQLRARGVSNIRYVSGLVRATGSNGTVHNAEGVTLSDGSIIVSVDSKRTPEKIARHELFHAMFKGQADVISRMVDTIRQNYTDTAINSILKEYGRKYGAIYGNNESAIFEEFLADAYAGINRFGEEADATQYSTDVRNAAANERESGTNTADTEETETAERFSETDEYDGYEMTELNGDMPDEDDFFEDEYDDSESEDLSDEDFESAQMRRDIDEYIEDNNISTDAVSEAKAIANGDMRPGEATNTMASDAAFDQLIAMYKEAKELGFENILKSRGIDTTKPIPKPMEVVSKVGSNTLNKMLGNDFQEVYKSLDIFKYLRKSEAQSLREAVAFLKAKTVQEAVDILSDPDRAWGSTELDAAMILREIFEGVARKTGDSTDLYNFTKVINEKGRRGGGQLVQAFAKWSRSPQKLYDKTIDVIEHIRSEQKETSNEQNALNNIEELDKQRKREASAKRQLDGAEEQVNEAQAEIDRLEKEIAGIKARKKTANARTEELDRRIQELEKSLTEAKKQFNNAKAERDSIKKDYNAILKELASVEKRTRKMLERIDVYQGKIDSAIDDIEETKTYLRDRINELDEIGKAAMNNVLKQVQAYEAITDGDRDRLVDIILESANIRKNKVSRHLVNILRTDESLDMDYLRKIAEQQIENIALDFKKKGIGQKLSTYQTIAHLFNLRTVARNVVSNQVFDIVEGLANDVGAVFDWMISKGTKQRTVALDKGWLSKEKRQGFREGWRRGSLEVTLDVDTGNGTSKYGTGGRRTWSMASSNKAGQAMSQVEKLMGYGLNVTDEMLKTSVYREAMRGFQHFIDNGTITQEQAEKWAQQEALYRAFQDNTRINAGLKDIKEAFNKLGGIENAEGELEFGLGDFVQKYTQVPGALISRSIEFSPIGYAKAIASLVRMSSKGKMKNIATGETLTGSEKSLQAQRNAALALGRATTGTGIIAAAAMLAAKGILKRREDEENKDIDALNNAMGLNGTQVNFSALLRLIAGKDTTWRNSDILFDFDFMEPINALLAIGTSYAQTEEKSLAKLSAVSLDALFDSILALPTMTTITQLMNDLKYFDPDASETANRFTTVIMSIASSSITGLIPFASLVRQIAQATDGVYRDQYTKDTEFGKMLDKIKNSIPGLRETLPVKLTNYGEEKTYGNAVLNAINSLVAPGGIYIYQGDAVSEELARVREETGTESFYPSRYAPYDIEITVDGNKEKFELTAEERQEYQKVRGTTTKLLMTELMASKQYQNATDDERAQMLTDVKNIANDMAKTQFLESKDRINTNNTYNKYYDLVASGVPSSIALDIGVQMSKVNDRKEAGEFKDADGKTIPNAEAMAKLDVVESYGVKDEKALLAMVGAYVSDTRAEDIGEILDNNKGKVTAKQLLDTWRTFNDMNYDENKEVIQASEFANYIDKNLPNEVREEVLNTFKFTTGFTMTAEKYLNYTDNGMNPDSALALVKSQSAIKTEEGKSSTQTQRISAILDTEINTADIVKALEIEVGGEGPYHRILNNSNLSTESQIKAAKAIADIPANEDGKSITQVQKQYAAASALDNPQEQIEAMMSIGDADTYNKNVSAWNKACESYITSLTPAEILDFKTNTLSNFDGTGKAKKNNGSIDQEEKLNAIESTFGYLDVQERAALYSLLDNDYKANIGTKGNLTSGYPGIYRGVSYITFDIYNAAMSGKAKDEENKK